MTDLVAPDGDVAAPSAEDVDQQPRGRWLTPLTIAIVVAPLAVLAVHVLRSDFVPTGDLAMTEMLTRDVGGGQTPSVGPFSRDGWFHPGPALFYVLALPYRAFGADGPALAVGAAIVNAVAVATMGVLAARRGGRALLLATMAGCSVLLGALGPTFLATPWNVYVTVLPYGAFLFLVWTVLCDDVWALAPATLAATFLIQTHVGFAAAALPLLAIAVAWTVGVAVRRAREQGRGRGFTTAALSLATAVIVGVVAWLPPLTEQRSGSPGNLTRIVEWFRHNEEPDRTLLAGWRVVADQFSLRPEWIAGQGRLSVAAEPLVVYERVVPVLLLAVAPAAVVLWRRGGSAGRALVGVWLGASALAIVSIARTIGPLYAYRLHWVWVLGMLGGALTAWGAWIAVRARVPLAATAGARRAGTVGALGLLAVLSVVSSVRAVRSDVPEPLMSDVATDLAADTVAAVDDTPGTGTVLVRFASVSAIGLGLGLVDELDRAGIDVSIEDTGPGEHRRYRDGEQVRAVLEVGLGPDVLQLATDPGLEIVAWRGERDLDRIRADAVHLDDVHTQMLTARLTPEQYGDEVDAVLADGAAAVAIERP